MSNDEGETDRDPYLVEIKRSARRVSASAGEFVSSEGRYRQFRSKALAREWARSGSGPGARVWIQDALPAHSTPADGYLVGGRRKTATNPSRNVQVPIDMATKA